MPQTPNSNKGPLAGLRILDMATVIAGPFAATLCADLGAEVTKLELPASNDPLRTFAPMKDNHSLYWKVTNRGKEGITLDVRKPKGRDIFLRMLPSFDVLVENFRTGTLDQWGLDIKTLHQANPQLIVLRLTGFGQTGPYARRPGFARIFEAMSGFTHLTGMTDGPPQHMNYPLGDVVAGLFGAFSITAALVESSRSKNMIGREIDLSATEAMMRLLDPLAVEYEELNHIRGRTGSRATYTAPSNIYKTSDGVWISVVGSSEPIFQRFCVAMGMTDLATNPKFSNNQSRLKNLDEIDHIISDWCSSQTFENLANALNKNEVAFTKVYAIDDVLNDPHFKERKAIIRLPDEDLGSIAAPCIVPRFSGVDEHIPHSGTKAGAHNASFYSQLGLSDEEISQLKIDKVI
ncbi:CaiB/BaiF CoA-transferase family protein [Polynucleobacter sp. JS-Fieb-80-E5]|uniref:CaiB/BaiF CoA transferase family protein n=1 Tax=Polynucleobacter sp. JS-Fieb-80-E5 TaxID=2081050 RepID=UPI001C0E43F7|nr:CoA transferase [Polynucleobacter sp. JS-Fieb-80-E5]